MMLRAGARVIGREHRLLAVQDRRIGAFAVIRVDHTAIADVDADRSEQDREGGFVERLVDLGHAPSSEETFHAIPICQALSRRKLAALYAGVQIYVDVPTASIEKPEAQQNYAAGQAQYGDHRK